MIIPKIIHHIWVGPKPPPLHWMRSWVDKNPGWQYILWDNERIKARKFKNQKHIDYYWERGIWHGVADVARYEILLAFGGIMPGSDCECLLPIEELFGAGTENYMVYENEVARPGLISPLLACVADSKFAAELIDGLFEKDSVGEPWKTTGNLYMQQMVAKTKEKITIFPSHFFNPVHFTGVAYKGNGKIYGMQHWGTTKGLYGK